MPHLVLSGTIDWGLAAVRLPVAVHRWGAAVLRTEGCWIAGDGRAMLVEGVVVEHSRPLHPVALAADGDRGVVLRLWRRVEVERTEAVQRWLAVVAADLRTLGAGRLLTTNLADRLWRDLALDLEPEG